MRDPKDIPEVLLQVELSLVDSLEQAATWHITRINRRRLPTSRLNKKALILNKPSKSRRPKQLRSKLRLMPKLVKLKLNSRMQLQKRSREKLMKLRQNSIKKSKREYKLSKNLKKQ